MLIAAGVLCFGYGRATAQTIPPAIGVDANAPHDLVLEVNVNGQRTSLLAHFREQRGRLSATGKDLDTIGLATDRLGISNAADVQLDAIQGLHYNYDAERQAVDLTIPDSIRKPYAFEGRAASDVAPATSSHGLVINYDAFAQAVNNKDVALYSEERYFNQSGVFSNSGLARVDGQRLRYTRYDTSWSKSNPATPSTIQIGDMISSSLTWTRSVRMGGFQWRSNFALRPDLITFPVPALSGSTAVPSAVDLYINSVRQFSGNAPSGPFIVNAAPGITGAGEATIVTRDALGRTVTTSVPLYVDTRLLARGLSNYSFEFGFLRRNYGLQSLDYDPQPAASASIRRGLTDSLTLESHLEATGGLFEVGAGSLVRLGMAGVVNGSVSLSAGSLTGTQLSLGYQLVEPHFSIEAQTTRAFRHYGDLAAREGAVVPSAIDQVTVALPFLRHQSIAASYVGYRLPQGPASKVVSMSYTASLGKFVSLTLSAHRDLAQHNAYGAFIALNFGLGHGTSISTTFSQQAGMSSYDLNALRPPDYAGGWGWGAQTGGGATGNQQAQLQYLGRAGELTAVTQRAGHALNASLDLTGALVLMDNSMQLSRQIYDSFTLVSTDGVAGIPVLHDNRVIGVTDRSGHLLVPDLNAYQNNRIAIDSMKLPVDTRVEATAMDVVPQAHAGVLARFGVSRYQAASVIVLAPDGSPLPPGSQVHHVESGKNTIVGYDGLTFIDGLRDENHLVIDTPTLHCRAQFKYVRPSREELPTIGPLTCHSVAGDAK